MKVGWALLGALVAAQVCYPLTAGPARAGLVVVTVVLGFAASLAHALATRGRRAGAALVGVAVGGFGVELLGVHTGVPFGRYLYTGTLGPALGGVPVVIGLAWAWMAWPAWLVAVRLVPTGAPAPGRPVAAPAAGRPVPAGRLVARVGVAAVALAAWDLFLDPQMVADGHWVWRDPRPGLPGVADVPIGNYLGWLAVAALVAVVPAAACAGDRADPRPADTPMYALYLWTYASSVLAHAAFLSLPASAAWGALGMGAVAVPLAVGLWRHRTAAARTASPGTPADPVANVGPVVGGP